MLVYVQCILVGLCETWWCIMLRIMHSQKTCVIMYVHQFFKLQLKFVKMSTKSSITDGGGFNEGTLKTSAKCCFPCSVIILKIYIIEATSCKFFPNKFRVLSTYSMYSELLYTLKLTRRKHFCTNTLVKRHLWNQKMVMTGLLKFIQREF